MDFKKIANKKIPKWLGWGVILILVGYIFFTVLSEQNELSKYGVETEAVVTSYTWGNKGMKNIEFKFKANNKLYTGYDHASSLPCGIESEDCVGTKVKIIYSSRDPNVSELVLGEGYY
ncbi:MAG: hypothetical protein COX70_03615 [Flavobacteriales bacterium CG_4_10_14_0_2_um_filter_32_8]|nr:MAG: hypothetical protein COX70_03615 [Flavobacteriales bacterium CG_4_10_14_0_2_um_filter_32_8]